MPKGFLGLPFEIRSMVYRLICDDDEAERIEDSIDIFDIKEVAILNVSQQFRREIAPMYLAPMRLSVDLTKPEPVAHLPCIDRDSDPFNLWFYWEKENRWDWFERSRPVTTSHIRKLDVSFNIRRGPERDKQDVFWFLRINVKVPRVQLEIEWWEDDDQVDSDDVYGEDGDKGRVYRALHKCIRENKTGCLGLEELHILYDELEELKEEFLEENPYQAEEEYPYPEPDPDESVWGPSHFGSDGEPLEEYR